MNRTFEGRIAVIRDATLFDIDYDLGFDVKVTATSRLVHPDTHETLYARDKSYGKSARDFVREWLGRNPFVTVNVIERTNGIAKVVLNHGDTSLNQCLLDEGYIMPEEDKSSSKVSIYDREDIVVPNIVLPDFSKSTVIDTRGRRYL